MQIHAVILDKARNRDERARNTRKRGERWEGDDGVMQLTMSGYKGPAQPEVGVGGVCRAPLLVCDDMQEERPIVLDSLHPILPQSSLRLTSRCRWAAALHRLHDDYWAGLFQYCMCNDQMRTCNKCVPEAPRQRQSLFVWPRCCLLGIKHH